jgi:hypothetical protein
MLKAGNPPEPALANKALVGLWQGFAAAAALEFAKQEFLR